MSYCKACGAPIWFIKTARGKMMPVNEQPVAYIPGGGTRLYMTESGNTVQGRDWEQSDGTPREYGYIAHWVTCPKAEQFRRKGSGSGDSHLRESEDPGDVSG